jgi:hypothetical protein
MPQLLRMISLPDISNCVAATAIVCTGLFAQAPAELVQHVARRMVTRYSCLSSAEQTVCLAPLTTPLAFPFLFLKVSFYSILPDVGSLTFTASNAITTCAKRCQCMQHKRAVTCTQAHQSGNVMSRDLGVSQHSIFAISIMYAHVLCCAVANCSACCSKGSKQWTMLVKRPRTT